MKKKRLLPKQIQEIKTPLIRVLKKHGVLKAGIFGSFARGDYNKNSDIDILVKVKRGTSLLDIISIEQELKKTLNRKIDLLTYKGINLLLKKQILEEEVKVV